MRRGSIGLVVGCLAGLLITFPTGAAIASAAPNIAGTSHGPRLYQLNPPANEWPAGRTRTRCWTTGFSSTAVATSPTCVAAYVDSFDAARAKEHVGPLILPSNWDKLSNPRQQFVLVNLERTARGESPLVGMIAGLSTWALIGANDGTDPPVSDAALRFLTARYGTYEDPAAGGYWDASTGSPLLPLWIMLYADACGPTTIQNSGNGACGPQNDGSAGLTPSWGHRDRILYHNTNSDCFRTKTFNAPCLGYFGAALGTHGIAAMIASGRWGSSPSWRRPPTTFTWASELPYLPACERHGDTCPEARIPSSPESPIVGIASDSETGGYWIATAAGNIYNVDAPFRGSLPGARIRPPSPVVGIAADPKTGGYWLVTKTATIYGFDAPHYAPVPFQAAQRPGEAPYVDVIGIAADPATGGYWVATAAGHIYNAHAPFYGSPSAAHLHGYFTSFTANPSGNGYQITTSAGKVYDYGARP